ncbi:transposase [Paraburkholderia sp. XV]|uniref:transposase n=1 Tax=Paraburkholderia sp. XV TaxID=2831520 RepID=UPI001CD2D066|nr:transposase [Paraburkholderia sp. XV]
MADDDRIDDGVVRAIERRKHSREFKEMVVRAAMQPHVSIAAVALHYRLNANLLRRWVVAARQRAGDDPAPDEAQPPSTAAFVPLQLQAPVAATDRARSASRFVAVLPRLRSTGPCRRPMIARPGDRGGCDDSHRRDLAGN